MKKSMYFILLGSFLALASCKESAPAEDPMVAEAQALQDSATAIGNSIDSMINAKLTADTSAANVAMVDSLKQTYANWKMAMVAIDSTSKADPAALKAAQQAWLDQAVAFKSSLQ
jgi:hypothetical protein